MMAAFFAAVALLLAGIGLYGVLTYSVLKREREFGIRIAVRAPEILRASHKNRFLPSSLLIW